MPLNKKKSNIEIYHSLVYLSVCFHLKSQVMNCSLKISKFELQSRYYVHFRTNIIREAMIPYPACYGLNKYHYSSSTWMDGFGIK